MRLFHLGDLHIGKRLGEFNLIDDQETILNQILLLAEQQRPDAVLLAGDIYDKSIPSGEAVTLFDEFLTGLSTRGACIMIVSGNHDSPERLNFGSRLMAKNGVHLAGAFDGQLHQVELTDSFGPVLFHLLPFVKPGMVAPYFPDREIESYEDAVRAVIDATEIDPAKRNILLAHQFMTANGQSPERSESESIVIGGLDNIDVAVFDLFDYVALGHLHRPQSIGRETIRYAGSPLKYSFSEVRHGKSIVQIDLGEKNDLQLTFLPLMAKRELREIRGSMAALLAAGREAMREAGTASDDYIRAILTDEEPVYDAVGQLRLVYPNLMRIDFENSRTQSDRPSRTAASGDVARQSPLDLFAEFYENQNNASLSAEQAEIMIGIFRKAGGATQ